MGVVVLFYGLFHAIVFAYFVDIHNCNSLGLLSPRDYLNFCDIKAMSFGLDVWLFFSIGAFFAYYAWQFMERNHGVRTPLGWSFTAKHLVPICVLTCFAYLLLKTGFVSSGLFNVLSTVILPLLLAVISVTTVFGYGILVTTLMIFAFVIDGKFPLLLLGFRLGIDMSSNLEIKKLLLFFPVLVALSLGSLFIFAKAREYNKSLIETPDINRKIQSSFNFILKPFWRLTLIEPTIAAHASIKNGLVQVGDHPWTAQKIINRNAVPGAFRGYALGAPALFAIFLGQKLGGLVCGFVLVLSACLFGLISKRILNNKAEKIFGWSLGVLFMLDFGKATVLLFLSIVCLSAYSVFCQNFWKILKLYKKPKSK
ncbi:hypothetical protein OAN95_00015 [Alphaproteobacteria bacterium]|nr:hypothetical protein [Alphaproteobacteria bacterium]